MLITRIMTGILEMRNCSDSLKVEHSFVQTKNFIIDREGCGGRDGGVAVLVEL